MAAASEIRQRQAEVEWRLEHDMEFYCAKVIKIRTKKQQLLQFVWNPVQQYVYDRLYEQFRRQGYIRALILKGRQMGISTLINAIGYGETSRQENTSAIVIAHDEGASGNLFQMISDFYAHDVVYHPEAIRNSMRELYWDTPAGTGLGSRYLVRTVGKTNQGGGQGRSFTFRFAHFSEVAFWGSMGPATMGAVQDAVPSEVDSIQGTTIIQETTAHGHDPLFYPTWTEIQQDRAKGIPNDHIGLFLPWYWHAPYCQDIDEEQRKYILQTLTEDERWLFRQKDMNGKPVTAGQLAWRRWKIKNSQPPPGLNKKQYFMQEFPSTPDEAFQATGSHIFDLVQVAQWIQDAPEPEVRYEFLEGSGEPVYRVDGRFLVWKEPDPMRSYIVGADVAEGLVHGDWSCCDVIDHHTGDVVAKWHGHIHPRSFGDLLAHIAHRYNNAWIGVERNNHGLTTLTRLHDREYKRLYVEEAVETPGALPRKRYGWLTSRKTKPTMVDTLVMLMAEEPESVKDRETYREMLYFQQEPETGEYGAQPGQNDDRLMSLAIARELRRILPTPKQQAAKREQNRKVGAPPPKRKRGDNWKAFS